MAYAVNCVPFYDTRQQQYTKILCVNAAPTGPLAARVQLIRPPRLSGLCLGLATDRCIHAITSFSGSGSGYMTPDDLPELFAFLATNGYTVDTGLTKLAAKHQPGGVDANANSLVCIISHA